MTRETDSKFKISGWYYDIQTETIPAKSSDNSSGIEEDPGRGRLTSITLHANRKLDPNTGKWVEFGENEVDPDDITTIKAEDPNSGGTGNQQQQSEGTPSPLQPEPTPTSYTYNWANNPGPQSFSDFKKEKSKESSTNTKNRNEEITKCRYCKDPIATSIYNEEFSISVANSWSEFGGDMFGEMWNNVKSLAPYADYIQDCIVAANKDYTDATQEQKDKIHNSKVASWLAATMQGLATGIQNGNIDVADYLNRSLVMQGTRFSYYSGSGTSFSNLGMKFTIFPKWNADGSFESVNDQVFKIYPYTMGSYKSAIEEVKEHLDKTSDLYSILDAQDPNMVQWMCPPGGFRANIHFIDFIQPGTLKLKFGAYFSIPNLVCENATFNYSKQMVKNPAAYSNIGDLGSFTNTEQSASKTYEKIISPLYCDVTLQFRPCTKYSDKTLKDFVQGSGNRHTLARVNYKMQKNIKEETERLRSNV